MKRRLCILFLLAVWKTTTLTGGEHSPERAVLSDTVSPTSWTLLIEARMSGLHDSLARLGVRPDATTDYDSQYEIPRPPPPPGIWLQVYFPHEGGNWPVLLGTKFALDYTGPPDAAWLFIVETNAPSGPVTLEWDTAGINLLPSSYGIYLHDPAAGTTVPLRERNSYGFTYTGPRTFEVWMEYSSTLFSVSAGWNIVSVSRVVPDYTKPALFPTGISPAYEFDDGYAIRDTLANGRGYWMKFPAPGMIDQNGPALESYDVHVKKGWNLIGSISSPVPLPASPIVTSLFYGYDHGYHSVDSLMPGSGYWVKTSEDGILNLGGPPSFAINTSMDGGTPDTLFVSGPNGYETPLYIFTAPPPGGADRYILPPAPPSGGFDARFQSGSAAVDFSAEDTPDGYATIVVRSPGEIIHVRLGGGQSRTGYEIESGPGQWRAISGESEPVAITSDPGRVYFRLRAVPDDPLPDGFSLERNYPNPFNPITRFRYTLPEPAVVEITVSDLSGRVVTSVPGRAMESGAHEYLFHAPLEDFASGVYFLRLGATGTETGMPYEACGKMVFLK